MTTATSCGESPMRVRRRRGDLDAGVGVVAGEALADDRAGSAPRRRRSGRATLRGASTPACATHFEQVPVDGEAVERVALRPAAHGVPLRISARDHAVAVEGLEHRDHRVVPRRAARASPGASVLGPRRAWVAHLVPQPDQSDVAIGEPEYAASAAMPPGPVTRRSLDRHRRSGRARRHAARRPADHGSIAAVRASTTWARDQERVGAASASSAGPGDLPARLRQRAP